MIVRVRLVVVVAYWRHCRVPVSWGTLGEERKVRRRMGAQCHTSTVQCRCTIGEKAREEGRSVVNSVV